MFRGYPKWFFLFAFYEHYIRRLWGFSLVSFVRYVSPPFENDYRVVPNVRCLKCAKDNPLPVPVVYGYYIWAEKSRDQNIDGTSIEEFKSILVGTRLRKTAVNIS